MQCFKRSSCTRRCSSRFKMGAVVSSWEFSAPAAVAVVGAFATIDDRTGVVLTSAALFLLKNALAAALDANSVEEPCACTPKHAFTCSENEDCQKRESQPTSTVVWQRKQCRDTAVEGTVGGATTLEDTDISSWAHTIQHCPFDNDAAGSGGGEEGRKFDGGASSLIFEPL